jgi:protein-tyrosine-phosphatase
MPSILLLCHANQFRSVVGEYALRARLEPSVWKVESAGLWASEGQPAVRGLAEWSGLPGIASHRSRRVCAELLDLADLIVVMERGQKEALSLEFPRCAGRVHLLSEMSAPVAYDIPDPALGGEDPKKLVAEIISLVEKGLARIVELAESNVQKRA